MRMCVLEFSSVCSAKGKKYTFLSGILTLMGKQKLANPLMGHLKLDLKMMTSVLFTISPSQKPLKGMKSLYFCYCISTILR